MTLVLKTDSNPPMIILGSESEDTKRTSLILLCFLTIAVAKHTRHRELLALDPDARCIIDRLECHAGCQQRVSKQKGRGIMSAHNLQSEELTSVLVSFGSVTGRASILSLR